MEQIDLRINSPGGSVFDGMAIMNALRRHSARVDVTVDGLAASAASFIAMAGDHIVMNRGSELMVHDAWGFAQGDAKTMRETAAALEKTSASIADVYAKRAGGKSSEWRDVMLAETWFTAEEAVVAGLADEWVDAPAAKNHFDLSRFEHRGRADAPAPRIVASGLPATRQEANEGKEIVMALRDDLIERLGLDAEASDEDIVSAVDEVIAEAEESDDSDADDAGDADTDSGDGQASVSVDVADHLPEGTQLIDASILEQLQADAAAGREALKAQAKARREGIVIAALREGRISADAQGTWLARMEDDEEGTVELLGTLAKNSVPVKELGHSDEPVSIDEQLYAKAWGGSKE